MTKVKFVSDSEEDRGKSFGGEKIEIVKKKKRSSGGGGGRRSPPPKPTVVYIVSDAPEDQGRSFGKDKILSPEEFERVKKSNSSSQNVQQREVNDSEREIITQQVKKEREILAEQQRVKQEELTATKTKRQEGLEQGQLKNIKVPISENQQRNQQQTMTSAQFEENKKTLPKVKATFSFGKPKENEINLNPARVFVGAYQLGATMGTYLAESITSKGQNVKDDVTSLKSDVRKKGVLGMANQIIEGTLTGAATDPFGFIGESAALGGAGKAAKTLVKPKPKVKPIEFETRSVGVETAANKQGLGVEVVEIKGKVQVDTPKPRSQKIKEFILDDSTRNRQTTNFNREIVDIEGKGVLNKETRILGTKDPNVGIIKENAISREFTPADIIEGNMQVSAKGKTTTVSVEGIKQGNKQITTVGKDSFFSETSKVGKLDGEDLFRTVTQNVKDKSGQVTLSQNVKSKGTTLPTQDSFTTATKSQTDTFFKGDKAKVKQDFIDAEMSSKRIDNKPLIENKQTKVTTSDDIISEIKIIDTKPTKKPSKTDTTSKTTNDFSFDRQRQVFEEKVSSKDVSTDFSINRKVSPSNKGKSRGGGSQRIETPISKGFIEEIVTPTPKLKVRPSISSGIIDQGSKPRSIETNFGFDKKKKGDRDQDQNQDTPQIIDRIIKDVTDQDRPTKPRFDFDTPQTPRNNQDNLFDDPTPSPNPNPPPTPTPNIPTPFKTPKVRIPTFGQGKGMKAKGFSFEGLEDDGRYIGSLGAAITGKTTKNPISDITGLKLRPVLITQKRK